MRTLLFILSFFIFSYSNANCEMDAKTIMDKVVNTQSAKSEREIQQLFLVDVKSNTKEKRTIERYSIDDKNGNTKSLINFTAPADIKGTALLSWNTSGSKDQWLYIPANRKLQRIGSGSKKNYFMGTDFTYADLDGEIRSENKYTCKNTTSCNKGKANCYVIEALPASSAIKRKTGYKKRILFIDKSKFVTYKIDYFNLAGKHFKTGRYQNWQNFGKTMRPEVASMDRHEKHKTFIKIVERNINKKLDDVVFTKRYLEKNMHQN